MHSHGESGAELVEFAMVLPLLLLLIAGITDFALLFQSFQVATNAAREGARLAVLPGYDVNGYAAVQTRAANYAGSAGLIVKPADVVVVAQPLDLGGGTTTGGIRVTVPVTYRFWVVGPIIGLLLNQPFNDVTFLAVATMRTEIQAAGP